MLDPNEIYNRKKQTLYNSKGIAVLKFKEETGSLENITGVLIENINNYIKAYPDRVEIFNMERQYSQLTLF